MLRGARKMTVSWESILLKIIHVLYCKRYEAVGVRHPETFTSKVDGRKPLLLTQSFRGTNIPQ
jgi:hypothetical protein